MPSQIDDIHSTGTMRFHDGNFGNNNLICAEVIVFRFTTQNNASYSTYYIWMRVQNTSSSTQRLATGELDIGLYANASDQTRNLGHELTLGPGDAVVAGSTYGQYITNVSDNDPPGPDPEYTNNTNHASFTYYVLESGDQIEVPGRSSRWFFMRADVGTGRISGADPNVDDYFKLYFTPTS